MKGMATVTLVALAAILCAQAPHAQDDPSKWLIGGWEGSIQNYSPREGPGRIMVVMAIAPDGAVQGMWGATGEGLGKAEIRLTETGVHLVTSAGSIVELTRVGEDRLEGSFTLKTGSTFALTLTKQKSSREEEKALVPTLDPRFLGVICKGKWSVMNNEASIQFSARGKEITAFYQWGPGTYGSGTGRFPGGSAIWPMRVTQDGKEVEYVDSWRQTWIFRLRDDRNIDALMKASGMYGALLECKAADATVAHTWWPDFMTTLKPGKSNSPVSAHLPADTEITLPASDLLAARAAWSGRWSGWACRDQSCDTKLAVEKVTNEGASIIFSFASQQVKPFVRRVEAKFVSNELQANIGGEGARVAYRMRPDGHVDFMWRKGQDWMAGILSKDK